MDARMAAGEIIATAATKYYTPPSLTVGRGGGVLKLVAVEFLVSKLAYIIWNPQKFLAPLFVYHPLLYVYAVQNDYSLSDDYDIRF